MKIHLPKGLRLELVDNDNYTVPVGTRMTVVGEREYVDTESHSTSVWVVIDNDGGMSCFIEFSKCKIIGITSRKLSNLLRRINNDNIIHGECNRT